MMRRDFFRKYGAGLFAAALGVLILAGYGVMRLQWDADLAEMERSLSQDSSLSSGSFSSDMPAFSQRALDDRRMTALFQTALTWDSESAYRSARSSLLRQHVLSEDSCFFTSFLPDADLLLRKDASGAIVSNPFDSANSTFVSFRSDLLSEEDNAGLYWAEITAQSTGMDANGSAFSLFFAKYRITASGEIDMIACGRTVE